MKSHLITASMPVLESSNFRLPFMSTYPPFFCMKKLHLNITGDGGVV